MYTMLLARADVASLLTMSTCIDIVEQVFRAHAQGYALMPPKIRIEIEEKSGSIGAMPSYLKDIGAAGLKWAGGWSDNPSKGLPFIMAEMFLIDPDSGRLKAVLEAGYITALRTGAATAVAARYLARRDSSSIAIIGAGVQGRMQLRALHCVFPVKDIRVADRSAEAAEKFAENMSVELGTSINSVPDIRLAVDGADIIVTATTADQPLVCKDWVSPGAFIASVGSYPELDPELVLCADKIIVDNWEQNRNHGEFIRLIEAGRLDETNIHGEMGAVVAGIRPGRESDSELIVAGLIGMGTHDVACAAYVVDKAIAQGRGAYFDFQQSGS